MKLSIIIVNYKVKYFIEQVLISVKEAAHGIETEVIVVDNDSQDDSIEYLSKRFDWVIFIANKENVGFAKANNQAVDIASGDYILYLNPDTLLGNGALRDSITFMDSNPDVGAVGVKMLDGRGNFLPESKRGFPTPWVSFCKIFGLSSLFPHTRLFGRYHVKYLDNSSVHQIDVMAGAYMMLRKDVIKKCGSFDEDFFMYGEDIDLSYRITKAGYKNFYLPIRILHYKGESTKKDIRYVKIFYSAMYIFFRKHYPNVSGIYGFFIRFAIIMRAFIAAIRNIFMPLISKIRKIKTGKTNFLICAAVQNSTILMDRINKSGLNIDNITSSQNRSWALLASDIDAHSVSDVVLSDTLMSYDEILEIMEYLSVKKVNFHIHTAPSGTIISSNGLIFDVK